MDVARIASAPMTHIAAPPRGRSGAAAAAGGRGGEGGRGCRMSRVCWLTPAVGASVTLLSKCEVSRHPSEQEWSREEAREGRGGGQWSYGVRTVNGARERTGEWCSSKPRGHASYSLICKRHSSGQSSMSTVWAPAGWFPQAGAEYFNFYWWCNINICQMYVKEAWDRGAQP